MESSLSVATSPERRLTEIPARSDEHSSGVSWGAVIGGAFVAAAISLIMLALGAGFDLSAVSPWSSVASSASALGTAAIVWLIVTQVVACALGGYLAGRLRTKWVAIHTDEVHFRDTANGFLVWAVGLVRIKRQLHDLQVPIAEVTPKELVNDASCFIEAVVREC